MTKRRRRFNNNDRDNQSVSLVVIFRDPIKTAGQEEIMRIMKVILKPTIF